VTEIIEPVPCRIDQQKLAQDLVDAARTDGVELIGPNGLLTGLTKTVLETALDAELTEHLGYDKHDPMGRNRGNSRNGIRSKTVLTEIGPVEIEVPRDRDGSEAARLVPRRPGRGCGIGGVGQLRPAVRAGGRAGEGDPSRGPAPGRLVTAAWATFDEVAAGSPAELRKGPRGGGRDRDKLIDHVIGAEAAYARKLGVELRRPAIDDTAAIAELREAIATVVGALRAAHRRCPLAGPRATRPAGSPGTSSSMPGRCRTGRRASRCDSRGPGRQCVRG
jgi:Transposase, Mutator family